jgi:hypothetical protein
MDPLTIPIHDIHLPATVSWWPPAPGWWILGALLVILAVFVARRLARRPASPDRERSRRMAAIHEHWRTFLSTYGTDAGDVDGHGVRELSEFLRRVALSLHSRESVAGLSGEAWLAFLDQTTQGNDFRSGVGRLLLDAPYRPPGAIATSEWRSLLELCDRWVARAVQPPRETA